MSIILFLAEIIITVILTTLVQYFVSRTKDRTDPSNDRVGSEGK
jgi:hypothetical protein